MIAIREEIRAIERGEMDSQNNMLVHAPHTMHVVCSEGWDRPYTREQAAFPAPWTKVHKYWPTVGRVDDVHGDRHLVCTCPPLEAYEE
jgi:glycine dehydrogenase